MDMKARWQNLVSSLGVEVPSVITEKWWGVLEESYNHSSRHYHNLDHVAQCLVELDAAKRLFAPSHVVEFALWFHDAVYTIGAGDNEVRSFELAKQCAADFGLGEGFVGLVELYILATKHNDFERSSSAPIVADIDLSILGKDEEAFDHYEQGIRAEYARYNDSEYKIGRVAFLIKLLARSPLYSSVYFFDLYEKKARVNIARLIERLLV